MARGRWITPGSSASTDRRCWRVSLPPAVDWLAAFKGAVDDLRFTVNWEQLAGITADEAASTWAEIYDSIRECDLIGTIVAYATSAPPSGCLACDGSSHLRIDYPALYAVLAPAFITDGDHFVVPDLRSRVVVGTGQGSGFTNRVMDDDGGEETHVLSIPEMPSHNHSYYPSGATLYLAGEVPEPIQANNIPLVTGDTGGGGSHNNMQPWRALGYAIVAE